MKHLFCGSCLVGSILLKSMNEVANRKVVLFSLTSQSNSYKHFLEILCLHLSQNVFTFVPGLSPTSLQSAFSSSVTAEGVQFPHHAI